MTTDPAGARDGYEVPRQALEHRLRERLEERDAQQHRELRPGHHAALLDAPQPSPRERTEQRAGMRRRRRRPRGPRRAPPTPAPRSNRAPTRPSAVLPAPRRSARAPRRERFAAGACVRPRRRTPCRRRSAPASPTRTEAPARSATSASGIPVTMIPAPSAGLMPPAPDQDGGARRRPPPRPTPTAEARMPVPDSPMSKHVDRGHRVEHVEQRRSPRTGRPRAGVSIRAPGSRAELGEPLSGVGDRTARDRPRVRPRRPPATAGAP